MVITLFRLSIPPEQEQFLEEKFINRSRLVDQVKGFISFKLLKKTQNENGLEYILMTEWETEEDYKNWLNSQDHARIHKKEGAPFSGNKTELFQVVCQ
ncbi:antibiotic biosynthesis monooxygenase [Microaerobacter geothermalis]|uniref:antibiotic biosynthesis monooxygenase family protein n=1 Tax=Microaerobacter geothermalis TaxID=674972 RepID=UPI001F245FD6|nr:antibiotic biosynthesis monooxygenase [Microaerobacter geothermalis]MCF6092677.1 antibiotic biosynthesis monooxygenase [Microaerobacter geothermalis]